jgi:tRNA(Ile)-lysidine synthase
MASSRKPPAAESGPRGAVERFLRAQPGLRGTRILLGLSGGLDSMVLLHLLHAAAPRYGYVLGAVHVHHGLSPNADAWARHCRRACRALGVPLSVRRVRVPARSRAGLEAAARDARHAALLGTRADAIALAHHLDDQAETVLLQLLRGAGPRGASAMPAVGTLGGKRLLRPLLEVRREDIRRYARRHALAWVEDESNLRESITRNYLRHRVGPLIAARFPRWRESLARAARHFAAAQADERALLRAFLAQQGLRAPSEARLLEMLKQLASASPRMQLLHDGARLRSYRGRVYLDPIGAGRGAASPAAFAPLTWQGERRLRLAALDGGELRFRRARGAGIDAARLGAAVVSVRLRRGGERLQPDPRRPRRTLKNLFQEAGIPPWQRDRLPLLYCGDELVWVAGLGVDCRYGAAAGAPGIVPEWRAARGDAAPD